jgi:hypothetical protein
LNPKLECSEELGDLCRPYDLKLALTVYNRAKCKEKVIALLAETGQYALLIKYALQEKCQPDWMGLLSVICGSNPAGAAEFAKLLILNETGPLVDKNAVVDLFVARYFHLLFKTFPLSLIVDCTEICMILKLTVEISFLRRLDFYLMFSTVTSTY